MDHDITPVVQDVKEAKARFASSLGAVKERLMPQSLAREALEKAKEKASDAAHASVAKVKANPTTAVGVAAAAILLLFRKPIFGAMKRLSKEKPNVR